MKKLLKTAAVILSILSITACVTTGALSGDEELIASGVKAWNDREPAAAATYWSEIGDAATAEEYTGYITKYEKGVAKLDEADATRLSYESKRSSLSSAALDYFTGIKDSSLYLPGDVCDRGAELASDSVSYLLSKGDISGANKMHDRAVAVYGTSSLLKKAGNEIAFVSDVNGKASALKKSASAADSIKEPYSQIDAYDGVIAEYEKEESLAKSLSTKQGLDNRKGAVNALAALKQGRQNVDVQRESVIRGIAYDFKDKMGEEFARTPSGDSKNMKWSELLDFYNDVKFKIEVTYNELLIFQKKYPKEVGSDIINDINYHKKELEDKIAMINRELANEREIASRGNKVMPILIGLFNPDPSSSAESKKSRPAKFSANKVKGDDYWWGMVSIPSGQMNDLVITMKDSRTVRVYNENTKSGKLIKKNNLKDLVSRSHKVGNSWPVMNAGKQLKSNKYFFQVEKGRTDSYSGEVVVYSSFVTRMR